MPGRGGFRNDNSLGRDGEGRGSGSWGNGNWGHRHNEHDNNNGQFSGQARDNNFRRNNRYFQNQGRNFGRVLETRGLTEIARYRCGISVDERASERDARNELGCQLARMIVIMKYDYSYAWKDTDIAASASVQIGFGFHPVKAVTRMAIHLKPLISDDI
ncbi:hypothetical protein Tco_0539324 [Tanacetum coccineum]